MLSVDSVKRVASYKIIKALLIIISCKMHITFSANAHLSETQIICSVVFIATFSYS